MIAVTLCTLSPRLGVVVIVGVVIEEFDSAGTLVSGNVSVFNTECDDGDNTTVVYSDLLVITVDDIALTDTIVVSTCVATDEDRVVITFDETDEDKVVATSDGDATIKCLVFVTALVVFNNGVVLITECDVDNGNVVIVGVIATFKDLPLSNCFVETIFVTLIYLVVDSVITSEQENKT